MKKSTSTWGGSRPGSGAKKKKPKMPVTLYIHSDEIERMGGGKETKSVLYSLWANHLGVPLEIYGLENSKK